MEPPRFMPSPQPERRKIIDERFIPSPSFFRLNTPRAASRPRVISPELFLSGLKERDEYHKALIEKNVEQLIALQGEKHKKNILGIIECVFMRTIKGVSYTELEALLELVTSVTLPPCLLPRITFIMLKNFCEHKRLKKTVGRMTLTLAVLTHPKYSFKVPEVPGNYPWMPFLKNLLKIKWQEPLMNDTLLEGILEVYYNEQTNNEDTELQILILLLFCAQTPTQMIGKTKKYFFILFGEILGREGFNSELKYITKKVLEWGYQGVFGPKEDPGVLFTINEFNRNLEAVWARFIINIAEILKEYPNACAHFIAQCPDPEIKRAFLKE